MTDEQKTLQELLIETSKQQKELLERFSEINEGLRAIKNRQEEHSRRMAMHMSRLMTLEAYIVLDGINTTNQDYDEALEILHRQSDLANAIGRMAVESYENLLEVIDDNEAHAALARNILSILKEHTRILKPN